MSDTTKMPSDIARNKKISLAIFACMNKTQLVALLKEKKNFLCVGLDTDITKIPAHLKHKPDAVFKFNKAIIDATKKFCVAYKINTAFYESQGLKGWKAMEQTVHYIGSTHFKIADAKRGDIGNTSAQYAKTFFETLPFDAVTVAPYMGEDSVRPFLEYDNKFTIVLGLTSNEGSNDFQQLLVTKKHDAALHLHAVLQNEQQNFLYEEVLNKVAGWGTTDNLMFVIGATKPAELKRLRSMLPDHFFLVPGVGAQGGSLKDVSEAGLNAHCGLLINASRAIIYAGTGEDFAEKAAAVAKEYQTEMSNNLTQIF